MNSFEETEQLAVDEKRKRLHYERIRIQEDREEIKTQESDLTTQEGVIDDNVYEDTKE